MNGDRMFNSAFFEEADSKDFGKSQFVRNYKDRQHISLSKLEDYDDVTYLGDGELLVRGRPKKTDRRYMGFKDLAYDFAFTVYDVNSGYAFAARMYKKDLILDKRMKDALNLYIKSRRKPNFEARIVGMQNGEDYSYLKEIVELLNKQKIAFYEIDLFGDNIRHVAIDIATGTTYNMLLLNRVYRPGELENKFTEDQFGRGVAAASAGPPKSANP